MLGLTAFKTRGADSSNLRPVYDAWRLRWWYRVAIVENHWMQCHQTFEAARSDASFFAARAVEWPYSREPAQKAVALQELVQMASRVDEISRKYKGSPELFAAIEKLGKQISGALGWFEIE